MFRRVRLMKSRFSRLYIVYRTEFYLILLPSLLMDLVIFMLEILPEVMKLLVGEYLELQHYLLEPCFCSLLLGMSVL